MTDPSIWNKEVAVPENVISYVDPNVFEKLPKGSVIVDISPHRLSYWTRTARIRTLDPEENKVSYFLKVCQGEAGKGMVFGEFHSMTAIHEASPNFSPKPLGWGSYAKEPDMYFFLCAFHEMKDKVPDVSTFPAMLAQLHKNGVSPSGKFGFPVPTYQGRLPQDTTECDTWEESFTRGIRRFFELEEESQGYDEDMAYLRQEIIAKVIPRLLRPLETEGRSVIPQLVHGDLWDGNTAVDAVTEKPLIFDACSSYAHHEYELAPWRPTRHEIGKSHVKGYLESYHNSKAAEHFDEEFDDRNALYCVRFNLCSSALYPGNLCFRNIVKEEMRVLVDKFAQEKSSGKADPSA